MERLAAGLTMADYAIGGEGMGLDVHAGSRRENAGRQNAEAFDADVVDVRGKLGMPLAENTDLAAGAEAGLTPLLLFHFLHIVRKREFFRGRS